MENGSIPHSRRLDIPSAGVLVPAVVVNPDTQSAPVVVLLHDTMSHKDEVGGFAARVADGLASRGIGSVRIDFRGNGESTAAQAGQTMENEYEDARAALDHVLRDPAFAGNPAGVVGFSQGGIIAAMLAGRDERTCALVSVSSGDFRMLDGPVDAALREQARTSGSAWMRADWGGAFEFGEGWFRDAERISPAEELARYDRAILAINAADDDVVPADAGSRLVAAAPAAASTLRVLPGGGHIFGLDQPSHPIADAVIVDIVDWLAGVLGSSPVQTPAGPQG